MPKQGTIKNPQFETESGVILELRPIPDLIFARFEIDYNKKNPPPAPPKLILANGEEHLDRKDETFIEQRDLWNTIHQGAQMDFIWGFGVITEPPKNWASSFGLNGSMPKLNWLAEILSNEETADLTTAILSINRPTEAAVEEAEKNSTSG